MILTVAPDSDVLMMDENDYRESMLLRSLDEEQPTEDQKSTPLGDSYSTSFSESTASLIEEDDLEEKEECADMNKIKEENMGGSPIKDTSGQSSDDESQHTQDEQVKPNKISSSPSVKASPSETAASTQDNVDPIEKGIPGKFDVLCGQSRICANHTGNRRFQVVLDIYAPKYDAATSKQEKMALTKEIVGCITHSGGRFLKYKDGLWQEISTVTARDKVSHALRTKVASWRRQQQQQQQQQVQGENPSPSPKAKPSHRRRSVHRRRRSSGASIATTASDIVTTSFDGNDPASTALVEDLLKTQREIFASLQQNSEEASPNKKKESHPLKR